jgi:hypothetical protein
MVKEIESGILSPKKLVTKEEGFALLNLIANTFPQFSPEKYNYYEPIKLNFDAHNIGNALDGWGRSFLWKRKLPKLEGSIWSSWEPNPLHSSITLTVRVEQVNPLDLVAHFQNNPA